MEHSEEKATISPNRNKDQDFDLLHKYDITPQELIFCNAYLEHNNGSKAAKIAKYSANNSTTQASRLLKRSKIRRYINDKLASSQAQLSPENIKEGIHDIARNGKQESNRLRAYEILAKIAGLLKEAQAQIAVFQGIDSEAYQKIKTQYVVVEPKNSIKDNEVKDDIITEAITSELVTEETRS